MYKLEDRILFDGAAAADVTDAQQEAEAQQQEAAEAEEAAQQEAAENAENADSSEGSESNSDSSTGGDSDDPGSLESVLAAIETANTGSDGQHIDVLVVSDSLENAEDIVNATSSDTIVVRYDARTTSAADLLQQITDALGGKLADTIGFATESGENAAVQLFADTDTSLDTVNNSVNQDFFHSLNNLMDEGAQLNLFASNLASTTEGTALVDAIGDAVDHDVAASIDETGSESAGGDWDLEYSTNDAGTDVSDVYFDENLIENFDSLLEDHVSREIAFINASVKDVDSIIAQLDSNTEIVMLEQGDALAQINEYLSEHSDIDTIRIFTHGNAGYINLGSTEVNSQYLADNPDAFAHWGDSLTEDADILIYGCNLAENAEGQSLISTISSLTGADVAASIDDTGVDGNWDLEFAIGVIEAKDIYVDGYQYNLAEVTLLVESIEDNPILIPVLKPYTLRQAIYISNHDLANTYKITFAAQSKLGGSTITLTAGEMVIENDVTILAYSHVEGSTYVAITVDAVSASRHFVINEGTTAVFDSFVLDNGVEENGGSIYNAGNLHFNAGEFNYNRAINAGGAIYNTGTLLITSNESIAGHTWLSDFWDFNSNSAVTAGGAIYNAPEGDLTIEGQSTIFTVDLWGNSVTGGSGGAIYSLGSASFKLGTFYYNNASADGGAVYVTSASGSTHFDTVDFIGNTSGGDGGGLYFTQGEDVLLEWCYFDSNTAVGDGGGIYFSSSGKLEVVTSDDGVGKNTEALFNNNSAGQNGGAIYMNYSGTLSADFVEFNGNTAGKATLDATSGGSGGAIYVINSGNVTLTDVNIEGGSARAGTVNSGYGGGIYIDSAVTTITTSNISNNSAAAGAGIYQMTGSVNLTNVTLAMNSATGNGGGIWFGNGTLDITYATIAYNSAANGSAIYFSASSDSTLSIVNSLVYESSATRPLTSQIYLSSNVSIESSSHNMFSHYNTNMGPALSDENYTPIERYFPGDANPTEIGQVDENGNIVGHDPTSINEIQTYTYLDTQLRYHANYRTKALAILYSDSLAYQRAASISVSRDQRGNNRGSAPTIGAFEPLYYVTVTSNGDDSSLVYSNDDNAKYFSSALENGLTLREAVYWLDTYVTSSVPTSTVAINTDRYVKFSLPDGYQIDITYGAIKVGGSYFANSAYKEIRVSITPDNIWSSDNTYVAQDAPNRIIVDANNTSGIFDVFGGSTFLLSNLTLQNGTVDTVTKNAQGTDYGRGGGIFNAGISYLYNVVVQNSTASNKTTSTYTSNAGWGGGIYNSGTMYVYDSTITGNTTTAYASDKSRVSNVSRGGGVYNDGTMIIERSTIDNNTATGNISYNTNAAQGGGIYNNGTLTIANSTITNNLTNSAQASDSVAGAGSAIFATDSSTITMTYCTVTYNKALLNSGDTPDEFRSAITVYDDPATTTVSPTFSLTNSIVAQNTVRVNSATEPKVTPEDIYIASTDVTVNDGGHNIIGFYNTAVYDWASGSTLTGVNANNNVLYYISNVLEYNGGKTMNYRLLSGSYALTNGISVPGYTTGQRGAERPVSNTSIGAYQILDHVYISSNADNSSTPTVLGFDFNANKPGFLADTVTLRDSFYWADPGTQIVVRYLDGSPYWVINPTTGFGNEIKLINGEIYISKSLTANGIVQYYNYVDNTTR